MRFIADVYIHGTRERVGTIDFDPAEETFEELKVRFDEMALELENPRPQKESSHEPRPRDTEPTAQN